MNTTAEIKCITNESQTRDRVEQNIDVGPNASSNNDWT
jgi:hypothetical protein